MDRGIINPHDYASAAMWRKREQLRGLIKNHGDLVVESVPLAAAGNVFTSAQVSLHDSEKALALSMCPLVGFSSVGLMPLDGSSPSLSGAQRIRWLDMAEDTRISGIEWCDDLLFLGSSRGRVLVADMGVDSVAESSGLLTPSGALVTGVAEPPLGEITVSPNAPASSTLVRGVRVNRGVCRTSLLGIKNTQVFCWDLNSGVLPVQQWAPQAAETEGPSGPVMFAEWAPGSDKVVLSGSYDGTLMLLDSRSPTGAALLLGGGGEWAAQRKRSPLLSGDFNPLIPTLLAASAGDGAIAVYDVRYPVQAVQTMPSLQGDVVKVRWWRLNADLLSTAGSDGSVALWSLRSPPSYCVGRAQYQLPMADLVTTASFTDQRALGVTLGGEMTMTGLDSESVMQLAPSLAYTEARGSGEEAAEEDLYRQEEQRACGYLYTRRLKEAYSLLSQCATSRLALHQTELAMQLVSHIDVMRMPVPDYSDHIAQLHDAEEEEEGGMASLLRDSGLSYEAVRQQYEEALVGCSSRLCTSIQLDLVRDLSKPNSFDIEQLEALRLNVLLHRVLETKDVKQVGSGVKAALDLIVAHPSISSLIDVDVVAGVARLLLDRDFAEGEKFIQFLLSLLKPGGSLGGGGGVSSSLLRAVLSAAQEPWVTMGLTTRLARGFVDRFFRDMEAAKDAVLTQLHIQRLGVENYREVIATVNAYQERCIQRQLPGMFGWMGLKPLLLFLHCLTADSNYVTFFWVSVQYIEAFARFPSVREVEQVLFAVVDRIHAAAEKVMDALDEIADIDRFSIPMLRQAENSLRTAHEFLVVLIRVQLECENVAVARGMDSLPPVMERVQDVLNTTSEDVLDAWAGVVDALLDCNQPDLVRKYCVTTLQEFSYNMEDLLDVSAKGENDERLNEILDVCDDFFSTVSRRKGGKAE